MPLDPILKNTDRPKVILLGSGGLSIGQAGEFDYSGTQAVKSLKEEGIEVIVVNPNVATVQTSPDHGKKVYLYPVEAEWVEKIIEKERPQGIIAGFGGQTALNCLLELDSRGVLKKYGVTNFGTSVNSLRLSEDRKKFADKMTELGIPIPSSGSATNLSEAVEAAKRIGFPVIVRAAYTLGGLGGGFAKNQTELKEIVQSAFALSPQVLVEKALQGWREVEYEVMRDSKGNAICICNMENFDPLGIHTGDSIVVAPSQTLTDHEYQKLRDAALKIVQNLEVIGECNVQFALSPNSSEYFVIEINARLSRSSALASKATGYPIAAIAAKVVLGHSLLELQNPVTKSTTAFYEPALDYLAVKIPRWDLTKFLGVSRRLGSTMKSVGEVMALGRSFPEALQKAVRMVTENAQGLSLNPFTSEDDIRDELFKATDRRLFAIAEAFRRNLDVEAIWSLTKIDRWFLKQVKDIVDCEREVCKKTDLASLEKAELQRWKHLGFGDEQIAYLSLKGESERRKLRQSDIEEASLAVRRSRLSHGIKPVVKKIDTTAGEFPAQSNYLYVSYFGTENDMLPSKEGQQSAIVLGSGPYSIGTSVEFDWCAVSCSKRLMSEGWRSIIINCNPETVSTDYNSSDHLYFEELTLERVLDIHAFEEPTGIIASMGGQTPIRLAKALTKAGVKILGHSSQTIILAENRKEFSHVLDDLGVDQPRWVEAQNNSEIEDFVKKVGYPVIVRPSFVLSGSAMNVAYDEESLLHYVKLAKFFSSDHPIVISEYLQGATEIEFDGVAQQGSLVAHVISEHIENAGVHSGDATIMVPPKELNTQTQIEIIEIGSKIVKRLKLHGPFNIQLLLHKQKIKVIECNARASRSFPFVSKMGGINLADLATDALIKDKKLEVVRPSFKSRIGVKSSVFSFARLAGADPVLGVEMVSTGEVGAFAKNFDQALLLSLQASGIHYPKKGILISSGSPEKKEQFLAAMPFLNSLKIPLFATTGTADYYRERGFKVTSLFWPGEGEDDCIKAIQEGKIDMVINIPKNIRKLELGRGRQVREASVKFGCSLFTNLEKAMAYFSALNRTKSFIDQHTPIHL